MNNKKEDEFFMKEALKEAKKSFSEDEVPVGAIVVLNGQIIGRGHNRVIQTNDASGHAEVIAIKNASNEIHNYRLNDCILYTTLEPCLMCSGLIIQSRIKKVIYAALDPKSGAVESNDRVLEKDFLNHFTDFYQGPLGKDSSKLLKEFFKLKRS